MRELTRNPNVSLVYGSAFLMRGNELRPNDFAKGAPPIEAGKNFFLRLLRGNPCFSCATMFRREAFFRAGQFRDSYLASPMYNDYSLWFRLAMVGDVAAIREPIGVWVKREGSVSDCSPMKSPARQQIRYQENTVEEIVRIAAKEKFFNPEEMRNLGPILARRWLQAAEQSALLRKECSYCLKRAWEIHPLAYLRSMAVPRILVKRLLPEREVVRIRQLRLRATKNLLKYNPSATCK